MGLIINEAGDELILEFIAGDPPKTGIVVVISPRRLVPVSARRMFYTEAEPDTAVLLEIGI